MTPRFLSALVLSFVLGAAGSLVPALSIAASAAEYGAIAYDAGTGRFGYSWHGATAAVANNVALNGCASAGCKIVIEIGPGLCGALATMATNSRGWGAASRSTRDAASLGAMEDCQKANPGQCKVQVNDCNQ